MKRVIFAAVLFLSTGLAHAQLEDRTAKASPHNFSLNLAPSAGGISLGFAYEYMYDASTGVGAHIRTFSKEDSGPNTSNGYMIVGAGLGHHFFKRSWDLSFTPSFNILSIDSINPNNRDDSTTMGPGLSIALVWAFTDRFAVGFDYQNYWVWFDEDWNGPQNEISDLSIKLRASF